MTVPGFDKSKVYMLYITFSGKEPVSDIIVPGSRIEEVISEHKALYPDFKKIYVFDADTKEAVEIIKP